MDFPSNRIRVERTVTRGENGEAIIATAKTAKSRRSLPMFGLAEELLAHHDWHVEVGLDASGHVFPNQKGRMLRPWTFNERDLRRVATAAGIEGSFPLYSFRHTFATLHLESNTPLKVVSNWLGHSTIQQTANTYQHVSADVSDDYAEKHVAWLTATAKASAEVAPN